jgi:hypothetical protein
MSSQRIVVCVHHTIIFTLNGETHPFPRPPVKLPAFSPSSVAAPAVLGWNHVTNVAIQAFFNFK